MTGAGQTSEEWKVRVYCDQKILREQIDDLSKEAAYLERLILSSPPGKAYMLQRKKLNLVTIEIERLCDEVSMNCFNKFRDLSEKSWMNVDSQSGIPENRRFTILDASFLVTSDKSENFRFTFEYLRKKHLSKGFIIETVSGNMDNRAGENSFMM